LHYYLLAPVRREVLVVGKYIAGLLTAVTIFVSTTLLSLFFFFSIRGYQTSMEYIFNGPGLKQILSYVGITVLACLGYGAVFMAISIFVRNPPLPMLMIYGWEFINFLLPPVLKKISITHYLQSLSPVPVPGTPFMIGETFAIVGEASSPIFSILGLLLLTAVMLALSAWRIRSMEVNYANE
jgi:ABC-type transport system involved in multi-copper enzyme maturation permease subunit